MTPNATAPALVGCLDDERARDRALKEGGDSAFLALWCIAFEDVAKAIPAARELLSAKTPERRYVGLHFLRDLELPEAKATADRLGQERNDFWTAFGPTNVALHEVSTAVELGDPGEVVRKGEALDPARFPPGLLGRRAQVFIDLARGYTQQRKDAVAVNMLMEAEQLAPEAVRYQVIVKEMLRELLRREHRASTPQLRPLAVRVGILREDAS